MENTNLVQENLQQFEIDYSKTQIKQLTPYLNDITIPPKKPKDKPKKFNLFYRSFAWYYVFNGNNKADAYRRAKYGQLDTKSNRLIIHIPKHLQKTSNALWSMRGIQTFNTIYIKEAIMRIRKYHIDNIKVDIPQSFVEQLQIQATYDPEMFYDPDGRPAFSSWEEIPLKYRCCIEHLETKFYGKNADKKVIVMKLTDRAKARQELYKFIDTLVLNPEKFEVIHKTLSTDGKEIGLNPRELTDEQLQDMICSITNKITDVEIAGVLNGK